MKAEKKPVKAAVLSLIAGLFFLFDGLIVMPAHGDGKLAMSLMISCGFLITISAIFLYKAPKNHMFWGAIVFLSSPLSIISYAFHTHTILYPTVVVPVITIIVFMVLGMIGGALAITHRPEK